MYITSIEKDNKKYKIYIDDQFLFSMYFTEIKKYDLQVNTQISNELLERIGKEVMAKRGTAYVYHLLSMKDYTGHEILKKLLKAGYGDRFANQILLVVQGQGIINDLDYAKRYIEQLHTKKSKRQLIYTLQGKGIPTDILNGIFDELQVDEYEAAKKVLLKKIKNKTSLSYEERCKLYAYMANRGFASSTIMKAIEEVMEVFSEL